MTRTRRWLVRVAAFAPATWRAMAQGGPLAAGQDGLPALVPQAGDPGNVDEVVLPEKPVVALAGSGDWDNGLKALREAFGRIDAELGRIGLRAAGRPLAVFTQTSDDAFRFDAMVPVAAVPTPPPALPAGMRFAVTPSGRAFRFVHRGAYDEIDHTYETITAYLDVKDVKARDEFIEEYLDDVSDQTDTSLTVNIYVQPR